jgi:hypothetical protein
MEGKLAQPHGSLGWLGISLRWENAFPEGVSEGMNRLMAKKQEPAIDIQPEKSISLNYPIEDLTICVQRSRDGRVPLTGVNPEAL